MKKLSAAGVIVATALLLVSCGAKNKAGDQEKAGAPGSATVAPIVDTSKAKSIDDQLAKYDEIVTRYLADKSEGKTEAATADESELATVSEALSTLAADFSSDQLTKYNEITARLNN